MAGIKIPHKLKDNKTSQFPHHFILFDTETEQVKINEKEYRHDLKLGVACYWRLQGIDQNDILEWKRFKTLGDFWDFVILHSYPKSRLFIISHNISFDFKVVKGFEVLANKGFSLRKLILNGTTNIWEFVKGNQKIVCLDDMNYFKMPLKSLGKSLGIDKLEMPDGEQDEETWFTYCQRDVEVMLKTWQTWIKFLRDNDLGTFAKTLASQAFNAFRHRFMQHDIYIHNDNRATALERESYHGGRTEAFFIGKVPTNLIYYLDVSSMYPSVMIKNEYPTKMVAYWKSGTPDWLGRMLEKYCVISKVRINTPENVFSTRYNDRLVFPTGRFVTTLTTRELQYAHERGYIEQVFDTALYEKANIFEKYVNFFYNSRRSYIDRGNHAFGFLCKLMLNSLYGKFGQRNEIYEQIYQDPNIPDGFWQEWSVKEQKNKSYRSINGVVEQSMGLKEGFDSFCAIPAHITADARLKLYDYMKLARLENIYYCDTDSIFTNHIGFENLHNKIKNKQLGYLDLVGTAKHMVINGLKDYTFDDKETLKGISKSAKRISENQFKQTHFEGLKGALHKGRINTMVTTEVIKTLNRQYNKGTVTANGQVVPFVLDN